MSTRESRPSALPEPLLEPSIALADGQRAQWGLLCYLAGDLGEFSPSIERDLQEILAAGAGEQLAIAIQHDGPAGATRYLLHPTAAGVASQPALQRLGRLDSGSVETLADFLRWALSTLEVERIAVFLGGHCAVDPAAATDDHEPRPFTICRDDSAGSHLDTVDLGAVIREVLPEFGREQIELLAGDMGHMQFLELAYELEGRVQVLLSSQTQVPAEGWNYTDLVETWKAALHDSQSPVDTGALVHVLVPRLIEAYRQSGEPGSFSISALDLRQLDDVARAFDTLCVSTMQALGEGLIWRARELLLECCGDASFHRLRHAAYDCGSFFVMFSVTLDAMASLAAQSWLALSFKRVSSRALQRFRASLAREPMRSAGIDPERRAPWLRLLAAPDGLALAETLRAELDTRMREQLDALAEGRYDPASLNRFKAEDDEFRAAIRRASPALTEERRVDFERQLQSAVTASHLADQSYQVAELLLGAAAPDLARRRATADEPPGKGMVLEFERTDPVAPGVWPRLSGAWLFRPPKLDDLMLSSYQRFAFHERVHWAALLGAANLIDEHPRALWRLISSLLATGGPGTRRDLMRRFTGADSVVWGLRDQFRAMAPAPLVTLSLERRRRARPVNGSTHDAPPPRESYVLRLDSASRGAVVSEQQSRVQPLTMDRALHALEQVLRGEPSANDPLTQLRNVGGLLGEDVFQALGTALEDEHQAALAECNSAVHLQLQIPRELMAYPWELMHHHGEWLSERFAIGRQVFMATGLARRVPRREQGRIRVLVVGDPLLQPERGLSQLPAARAEADQVAGFFERLRGELGDVIDFVRAKDALIHCQVSCAELRARLREGKYDIVHFAGHGTFKQDDPEASAWQLSDGELWALEIRNTLIDHPAPPWLVYANACESALESQRRYQGNVFGLASAFINQGVGAYIAPLWPIEDLMAQHIALQFYRQFLCERRTLGESLRRAKASAREVAFPPNADEALPPVSTGSLGWASLVLYGDPTEELFQALGGKEEADGERASGPRPAASVAAARSLRPLRVAPSAPLHAPDHVLAAWVGDPSTRAQPAAVRGEAPPAGTTELQLIEEAGLRRFRVRREASLRGGTHSQDAYEDLPGSSFGRLLADERVRGSLPARRGVARVIGRWIVSGFADGLTGLVRQYDRDQVAQERLLLIGPNRAQPLTPESLPPARARDAGDRALLIIHGTFSKTASPVEGFGPEFLRWARQRYRVVLGFDHWTLSKTPLDNAELLAAQLHALAPELLERGRLDVITHSRGGLVARAFSELLDRGDAVRSLAFLGTPNCGTDLANPNNWGALANTLVNLTGLDHSEMFGRLAGLLARLAIARGELQIPGLLAQNPLMAAEPSSFLARLQRSAVASGRTRYAVVTAEFEPSPLIPDLRALWRAAAAAGIDSLADSFFARPNDLIVNTEHVWCIDQPSAASAALPAALLPSAVLAFVPPRSALALPRDVSRNMAVGVHHCNLFSQPRTQEFLQRFLQESEA